MKGLWASLVMLALAAGADYPGASWERHSGKGWSRDKLRAAREYSSLLKTAAVFIVQDGRVVDEWGDTSRKYQAHAMRKPLLGALIGIRAAEGRIPLAATLADLKIDDDPPLSDAEKQARVIDLLRCRSGVYHGAVAEVASTRARRPARHAYPPDRFFHYSNWDANTLLTIFEQQTNAKFADEFQQRLAQPLGMQDFELADASYQRGPESRHAAYPVRISSRDLARFGLLYLREGRWPDERGKVREVVPRDWVRRSVASYSDASAWGHDGYGYLWWVDRHSYSTDGARGHHLIVFPAAKLVIVHRVDTFVRENEVNRGAFRRLLRMILDAAGHAELALEISPPPGS
jgi:CubicO group peptidase (beta-lactamase class C family)